MCLNYRSPPLFWNQIMLQKNDQPDDLIGIQGNFFQGQRTLLHYGNLHPFDEGNDVNNNEIINYANFSFINELKRLGWSNPPEWTVVDEENFYQEYLDFIEDY